MSRSTSKILCKQDSRCRLQGTWYAPSATSCDKHEEQRPLSSCMVCAPPGVNRDPRLFPLLRLGIRVCTRVRSTKGHCHPAQCARRLGATDNLQAHMPWQPNHRVAAGNSPPCHGPGALLSHASTPSPEGFTSMFIQGINMACAHRNFGQSQFTTTPLPRGNI